MKGDTVIENKALFGEVDWTFAPRWTLVTGLRYDTDTKPTTPTSSRTTCPTRRRSKSRSRLVLPKLGINYELATGQYLGFIAQKGYRGWWRVRALPAAVTRHIHPEYTTNYELVVPRLISRRHPACTRQPVLHRLERPAGQRAAKRTAMSSTCTTPVAAISRAWKCSSRKT